MNLTLGIELEFADVRAQLLRKHLPEGWCSSGDNSIRNTDGTFSESKNPMSLGAEVRTEGGHTLESLIPGIHAVYELVSRMGGTVTANCGLHVHVGFGDWDADTMMQLVRYFGSSRPFGEIVKASKHRRKWFCAPVDHQFVADVAARKDDLPLLKSLIARVPMQRAPYRERDVNVLSLLDHGTIEYRAFNQTMSPELAINCLRYAHSVTVAALTGAPLPLPTSPLPEAL